MEGTHIKKIVKKSLQILLPLVLGAAIMIWMYRGFNFGHVWEVLDGGMDYSWMLLSLVFGVFSHIFRGWRWKLTLAPLGEYPKTSDCVYAVFVSYAANLIVPRVGEISRCGILAKYDGTSFPKSLGTVVTERLVDTLTIFLITGITVLLQMPVFVTFLENTGTKIPSFAYLLTSVWFYIVLFCFIGVVVLLYYLRKTLFFYERVKGFVLNIWEGIMSLKGVRNIPLFIFYTLAIWACYFFHFYFTFYCFAFTAHLGILAALVMFVGGTFAVIVPTPNGAGPWHFAIMEMMMLYGVNVTDAGIFALIVHGIQTFLVVLLGVYGLAALPFTNRQRK